jgi:hypothetical protein
MAFGFNWRPQQIPTQMKGAQFAPQKVGLDQDFPSLVNGAIGRSPEEIAVEQNLNERQVGNANDMANWIQQGGTPQADATAAAQAQAEQEAAAKQQRIKEIEAEIAEIEQRIAERKRGMSANEDALNTQLAAIEARKINQKDPTSIWRWKAQMDENRRIANAQKTDNTAKANAMIEIANDLDSIIVDDKMTSQDQKAYLSKLSNMKTLGEKAGVPKSVIDNINAKIAEVKGETNSENKKVPEGSEYEGTSRDKWDNEAKELLSKPNLTQGDIMKFKQKNPNISNEVRQELEKKHAELIDRDNKKNEARKFEQFLKDNGFPNGSSGMNQMVLESMKRRWNKGKK